MKKTATELAREHYHNGYNCAEAIWLGLNDDLPDEQKALGLKLASGFGGGMGCGGLCGGVAGAIMAIGRFYGRELGGPRKEDAKILAKELIAAIESKYGSANCSDLKPATDDYRKRCVEYVAFCADKAIELMDRGVVDEGCG